MTPHIIVFSLVLAGIEEWSPVLVVHALILVPFLLRLGHAVLLFKHFTTTRMKRNAFHSPMEDVEETTLSTQM